MSTSRLPVKMTFRSYWFRTLVSSLLLSSAFLCTIPSVTQAKIIYSNDRLQGDVEAKLG